VAGPQLGPSAADGLRDGMRDAGIDVQRREASLLAIRWGMGAVG
jgi:hypothetical protein